MRMWRMLLLGLFLGVVAIGCGGPGPTNDGESQRDMPPPTGGNPADGQTEADLMGEQPAG